MRDIEDREGGVNDEPIGLVKLGDAVELTLGEGGGGWEDKRFEYN